MYKTQFSEKVLILCRPQLVEIEGVPDWETRLRYLNEDKADLLLYPSTLTYSRFSEVQFLNTCWYSMIRMFSGNPKEVNRTLLSNLLVMDLPVTSVLLLSLVSLSVVFVLYKRFKDISENTEDNQSIQRRFFISFWNFTMTLFAEPYPDIPLWPIIRLMCGCWLFALFFITAQLGGSMKSEFSSKQYLTVDSLEDLNNYDHLKPLVMNSSGVQEYFLNSPNPIAKEVYKKTLQQDGLIGPVPFKSLDTYNDVFAGRSVIINDYDQLLWEMAEQETINPKGSLYLSRDALYWKFCTHMVTKNFSAKFSDEILQILNRRMRDMFENSHWYRLSLVVTRHFDRYWFRPTDDIKALTMEQLIGVFYIFGVGCLVSLGFFVMEIVTLGWSKGVARRKKKQFETWKDSF